METSLFPGHFPSLPQSHYGEKKGWEFCLESCVVEYLFLGVFWSLFFYFGTGPPFAPQLAVPSVFGFGFFNLVPFLDCKNIKVFVSLTNIIGL